MKNKYFPNWKIRKLDVDLLKASLTFSIWTISTINTLNEDEMVRKLEAVYKLASEIAIPRKGTNTK